VKYYRERG